MRNPVSNPVSAERSRLETLSGQRLCERSERSLIRFLLADDGGQVLPWVAVATVVMVSTAALVLDIGNAMVAQRQLQNATDAAALAAAQSIAGTSTAYQGIGVKYGAASGDNNAYANMTINTPTVTPLCLKTVSSWGIYCASSGGTVSIPNAVQVTETATVHTFFGGILGKGQLSLSATSTAADGGRPYNIALIVDSTLSMNSTDSNCGGLTQEQCALQGVRQLLTGISPQYDYVSLFTFPNIAAGSGSPAGVGINSNGTATTFNCTTTVPSSYEGVQYLNGGGFYAPVLLVPQTYYGSTTPYQPPWSGIAWAMPYTFPPIPTSTGGYTMPTGTEAPTYEVVPFVNDYNTSASGSVALNTSSSLVRAAGGASSCGGLAPSSYDGNYGTYYAGALYAAQAALLAEQTQHAESTNVMIVLGDGDSTSPDAATEQNYFSQIQSSSPGMPTSQTQSTTTYGTSTSLNTSAYSFPGTYKVANSSGTYPSYVGECGQAVDAAQYAATYTSGSKANNTVVFTIAYGALSTSQARSQSNPNGNCGTDVGAGKHPNITPCQTLQQMATQVSGYSTSPYFYSDYTAQGGDPGCQANSNNSGVTAISDIYNAIAAKLMTARLIPNNVQ